MVLRLLVTTVAPSVGDLIQGCCVCKQGVKTCMEGQTNSMHEATCTAERDCRDDRHGGRRGHDYLGPAALVT